MVAKGVFHWPAHTDSFISFINHAVSAVRKNDDVIIARHGGGHQRIQSAGCRVSSGTLMGLIDTPATSALLRTTGGRTGVHITSLLTAQL